MRISICLLITIFSSSLAWSDDSIQKGQEAYLSYGCAVCHGKEGRGDGLAAKTFDLPPTNFYDRKTYRHGYSKGDVIYAVKNGGSPDSGMPSFKNLTTQELQDIAAYVVSLQEVKK